MSGFQEIVLDPDEKPEPAGTQKKYVEPDLRLVAKGKADGLACLGCGAPKADRGDRCRVCGDSR